MTRLLALVGLLSLACGNKSNGGSVRDGSAAALTPDAVVALDAPGAEDTLAAPTPDARLADSAMDQAPLADSNRPLPDAPLVDAPFKVADASPDRARDTRVDTARDTYPSLEAGLGGCSAERLLSQAEAMANAWKRPDQICLSKTSEKKNFTDYDGDVQVDVCSGSECGSAGTCQVRLDWLKPFTATIQGSQILVSSEMHDIARCTVKYTHGTDTCTCVVDPDVLGKWEWRSFRATLTPTTSGDSGPLTFKSGSIQSSGPGVVYSHEVVTCTGSLVSSKGVDTCTADPNSSTPAMRSYALSDCYLWTDKIDVGWFFKMVADFRPYVETFAGSCP